MNTTPQAALAAALKECMNLLTALQVSPHHRRDVVSAARAALAQAEAAQPVAAELAEMEARKDAAYLERNRCVALVARMALALGRQAGIARTAIEGWSADWHGCVYIDLPTGQASWHFHDSQAHLFAGLPPYAGAWDGHDTPTKYERVAEAYAAPKPAEAAPKHPKRTAEQMAALVALEDEAGGVFAAGALFEAAPQQEGVALTDEQAYHLGRGAYEVSVLPADPGVKVKAFWQLTTIQQAGWVAKAALSVQPQQPAPEPVAAESKDAARYRWLRDKAPGEIVFDHTESQSSGGSHFMLIVPFDGEPVHNDAHSALKLDAAIDAMLAAAPQTPAPGDTEGRA